MNLVFNNKTAHAITFQIYPVSMVFNGRYNYDLFARFPTSVYQHISGSAQNTHEFEIPAVSGLVINHDWNSANGGTNASVGYGIYKFVIFCPHYSNYRDSGLVEWDALYPYDDGTGHWDSDLNIEF